MATEVGASLTGETTRRLWRVRRRPTKRRTRIFRVDICSTRSAGRGCPKQSALLSAQSPLTARMRLRTPALSRTYAMMLDFDMGPADELRPLAVAAAARAIELNPDLAETNLAFAYVKYHFEHDWEAADAAYQRALSFAPHASIVLSPYSRFLCAAGRLDEALDHARAGVDADPLSAEMAVDARQWCIYYRREFDDALQHYQRAISVAPSFGPAHFGMARVYSAQGEYSEGNRPHPGTR